jgi:6-phosphogluconolactonase
MTRLTTCADPASVAARAAIHIATVLERARAERGIAHLAVSGGTTPGLTYELISKNPDELAGTELWFADERCVGPEDEQSNYLLARQTGLAGGAIADELVHRMKGELGPGPGAEDYAALLSQRLGRSEVPALDLVVLGIGPDGHVASLFPGSPALQAGDDQLCLGIEDSPKPPPQRITLSLPVLRAARSCLLLATGAGKADAVDAMLGEPSQHVPASMLRRERLTVILDDAAAPGSPPR